MKFSFFHLMPYPYLPDDFDEKYDSPSLTFPNAHLRPRSSATGSTTATSTSSNTPTSSGSTGSRSTSTTRPPTG